MIGKIERVSLKQVFPHEAHDLTPWLSENADVISDSIGIDISIVEREGAIGTFSADLIAEADGEIVVIENQFGKSDHDHLGKLVTYVSGRDAKIAIWITEAPRPEHTDAINWLNSAGLCAFFLFKLEAIRIGDSDAAPLLTLITGPSEEILTSGEDKKDQPERYIKRRKFWEGLLDEVRPMMAHFKGISASKTNYLTAASGVRGVSFVFRTVKDTSFVECYLDHPLSDDEISSVFAGLKNAKDRIEDVFGGPLVWDYVEARRGQKIRYALPGSYGSPQSEWPRIYERLADAMERLERAIRPFLHQAAG